LFFYVTGGRTLNEYISHYETLDYDAEDLHRSHTRAKRSVTQDAVVHLHFRAHSRAFSIRLKRDLETFSDKLEVLGPTGKSEKVDTSHIYKGHILGKKYNFTLFRLLYLKS
jgi:disintegrin and metalloproteinase domain-containing protein 10